MIPYPTKSYKLSGSNFKEVKRNALIIYKKITSSTKRRPYVRSAYFRSKGKKQKIFFDYFWVHLSQKSFKERAKRLKYFKAAIEVIRKSRDHPASEDNPHKRGELLHRFAGLTKDGELFYVQIKEDKRSGKKYFMSCFPEK